MSDPSAKAFVVEPGGGELYWQPVPANGHVRNILSQAMTGGVTNLSMGTQTVAPGCFIREHAHVHNEEIIHVLEGRGIARLDGADHPIARGATVYIGPGRRHHFLNPNAEPMTFLWIMTPGGLDHFFAEIGRARVPSQPAPEPFPRPADIAEIEARTVFGWTDRSYDAKTT